MKVNEKLSILVLQKSARKSKDGAVSLDVRITLDLKRATFSLGQKVPENLNRPTAVYSGISFFLAG
jgi:hypothetical protein